MEFCLHGNWVLADDDTGKKNGRMDGMRADQSGSFNQAKMQATWRGWFYSLPFLLNRATCCLFILLYFTVAVITLVWSVMV